MRRVVSMAMGKSMVWILIILLQGAMLNSYLIGESYLKITLEMNEAGEGEKKGNGFELEDDMELGINHYPIFLSNRPFNLDKTLFLYSCLIKGPNNPPPEY